MTHVAISHKSIDRLAAIMAANNLKDYGEVCSAAINYPKGTFTQVGEPVYDGVGCVVKIDYEDWREADLEVIAQRAMCRDVPEWIQSILTA